MGDYTIFEQICVCCLTEEGTLKVMANEIFLSTLPSASTVTVFKYKTVYKVCAGIELDKGVGSCLKICSACEQKLKVSFEFRELCRSSYQTLTENTYVQLIESPSDTEEAPVEIYECTSTESEIQIETDNIPEKSEPKKVRLTIKQRRTSIDPPSDIEVSDLEAEFICLHGQCDIVLTTYREYKKHYEQHRNGKGYNRVHRVCDICNEETKMFTRHIKDNHKDFKPFKCKYCTSSFQTSLELRNHLVAHTSTKNFKYECKTCHEKFKFEKSMREHIKKHIIGSNHYFCPNCGMSFMLFTDVHEHFQCEHANSHSNFHHLFPCFDCKKIFLGRKFFDSHKCSGATSKKVLNSKSAVTCARCSGTFVSEDEYVCHQFLGCREVEVFDCETCKKEFVSNAKLVIHTRSRHMPKQIRLICDICGHGSANEAHFNKHRSSHLTEQNFKCHHPGCSSSFKNSSYLQTHFEVHKPTKYVCDICEKRCRRLRDLRLHMASHSDSIELRRYPCEICGKRYTTPQLRARHRTCHTGVRNFKCKDCPKLFLSLAHAQRHFNSMHLGLYYQCNSCNSTFTSTTTFQKHLFLHRGFYPYNCPKCSMHFSHRLKFKKHLLDRHQVEYNEAVHGYNEMEDVKMRAVNKECQRKKAIKLEEKN